MLNYLLATNNESTGTPWLSFVILGVLIVAIIVMFIFSGRRRKKQEQDAKNLIDAVKPGNKVKTIGGICGIVVEVDTEENTFVLETGTEQSGKCFIKFDRQAIYQTDAVVEKKEELPAETPGDLKAETEDTEALTEKEDTSEDKKD
ncbi:MAG: preprotein translocase subunit YajC [Clostridia bacterium]|nr:preprotein translocase subunit YajC [Clostridia bacterium]